MNRKLFFYSLSLLFLLLSNFSDAQTHQEQDSTHNKESFFEKVVDIFEFSNEAERNHDTTKFRMKFIISPILSYTPETNLGFGAGMKLLFKPKHATSDTRTSNMPISAIYTLNNQIFLRSGYVIFFNEEKWILKGNIGYSKFPQLYYGIGNDTPLSNEQLIEYQNILIEPLLMKRVVGKLFLGGGVRYNRVWDVSHRIKNSETIVDTTVIGYNGSVSAGLELAATYDSRDNVLNAYHGSLLEFRQGFYGETFGGVPFELIKVDLRKYLVVSKKRQDVLAGQLFGHFTDGRAPLIDLAALGGKELMRGFYEGRFRNKNMLAGQIEYRTPIVAPIGMVFFAGTGQTFNNSREISFDNLKYSVGGGLRVKIVKSENVNLRFDVAYGEKWAFYFGLAEAF